ncbi:DUF3810 domain-containing protein [Cyclobacterium qasimii]|uniref:DUF3810 domain-containing protein n=2 Tax=Cyclobacterium qasimii TaxID=1350429 RepID=S7V7D1_9BACT|nr:DUF3810 domain-containing protein [Cyclobacterium qasimii]EPR65831.1 hypothetical protein ADICYQ_5179 [Cyclobacterium qasimii M12-11B]GEO23267.1 membrane protein [Cyclobacterium qasimii]
MGFSRWVGGCLGLFAIVLRFFAAQSPQLTEKWYSATLYPIIRGLLDHTLVLLPFPAIYLLLVGLLFLGYRFIKNLKQLTSNERKLLFFPRVLINFFGWVIFLFLMLWGFNYYRIPLYQHLNLNPEPLSLSLLVEEIETTQKELVSIRSALQTDTTALPDAPAFSLQISQVRDEMKGFLKEWNHSWRGNPVVKQFQPEGTLRKLGIFGIYFPFTGEGYLDPSLHPLEKSFTMSHELAHGFGITNEGEANFMAWLICSESDQPFIRYSATLKLFRYQLNDLYRMDEEGYALFVTNIPEIIKRDIKEIQVSNSAIRPYSIELSRKSNDLYLKTQGVKEGVKSYAQLPMLVHAWKAKEE